MRRDRSLEAGLQPVDQRRSDSSQNQTSAGGVKESSPPAHYRTGVPEIDQAIRELVAQAQPEDHSDLITEMVTTVLKLGWEGAERWELKLFNSALKEMRYTTKVFRSYTESPKVTIFGSARTSPDHPDYQLASEFARVMWEQHGWMVVTGAGPGIMEAGNRGAGLDGSFGVHIRLPFENQANEFIHPDRLINFKYFFTRKLGFVKESRAFVVLPGGFGTMDEAFELLTLIQTGKAQIQPVVMMEAEPGYWEAWYDLVKDQLLGRGMISRDDMHLFSFADSAADAVKEIRRFYANFHSQRYVGGRLVIRLRFPPTPEQARELTAEFSDIVEKGTIEAVDPHEAEVRDRDALDCHRLALAFDRRSVGRLRLLIDRLNQYAPDDPVAEGPIGRLHPS